MGLLFPKNSNKDSKKLGAGWLIRVLILILITIALTWYGKFYTPPAMTTNEYEFSVWIMPHKDGLGAFITLPNDNLDTNNVRTGLRIWVSPPDSMLAFERGGVRYRGKNIVVVGDSVSENLREDMLSTLDGGGGFYWLTLGEKLTGRDVDANLKLFNNKPENYLLDLVYEGYKLRFYGSQVALDSAKKEPLSVALLMFKTEKDFEKDVQAQIVLQRDSLNYKNAIALISYNPKAGLSAKKMHRKGWEP